MRSLSFTKTIGAGAFGTVYLAEMVTDRDLRRQVAVAPALSVDSYALLMLDRLARARWVKRT